MEVDDLVYIKREWVGAQRMVTDKTALGGSCGERVLVLAKIMLFRVSLI